MDGPETLAALGGAAGCRAFSTAFYARVALDPVLRPLFPKGSFHCAIEEFAAFLAQFLGGPPEESQRRWWLSLRESHSRFAIGEREREAWMRQMMATLADLRLEGLQDFFDQASRYVRGAPSGCPTQLTEAWNAQMALDETVKAIDSGNAPAAIGLVPRCNRTVLPGILARMIATHNSELLEYAHTQIRTHPELVREYYAGRTLLHSAAGKGSLESVNVLLAASAEANVRDGGRHTPLYSVANECHAATGPDIVRALVRAGGDVNAAGGVQRCTPLHMAARRGNAEIAEALLECGAALQPRDKRGDTPRRRALNCGKLKVAELLAARGARA